MASKWQGLVVAVSVVAFTTAVAFPALAAEISVAVLEQGLPEDAPSQLRSSAWEAGLMDCLFDGGHIASNAPIQRLEAKGKSAALALSEGTDTALREAKEAGEGYLFLAVLQYSPSGDAYDLVSASLSLRNLATGSVVAEIPLVRDLAGKTPEEQQKTARGAAVSLLSRLKDR